MKYIILFAALCLFGACKKDNSSSNPNTTTDAGSVTWRDTTYKFNYTIVQPLTTSSTGLYYYVTLGGGYVGGYRHTIGMALESKPPAPSGTIRLGSKNVLNFLIHPTDVLNAPYATYHYYYKPDDVLTYEYINGKIKITGTNLTETDENRNILSGGRRLSFTCQE